MLPSKVLPVTRTVIFGLAEINIKMITSKGRKPVKDPIQWLMLTYVKGDADKGKEVANTTGPTASFTVPAGGYVVRANYKGVIVRTAHPSKFKYDNSLIPQGLVQAQAFVPPTIIRQMG